jgi:hypothetical protein
MGAEAPFGRTDRRECAPLESQVPLRHSSRAALAWLNRRLVPRAGGNARGCGVSLPVAGQVRDGSREAEDRHVAVDGLVFVGAEHDGDACPPEDPEIDLAALPLDVRYLHLDQVGSAGMDGGGSQKDPERRRDRSRHRRTATQRALPEYGLRLAGATGFPDLDTATGPPPAKSLVQIGGLESFPADALNTLSYW